MRFFLTGLARPKQVAQHLSAMFPANKLSTSQEWTAKLYGYRDWHEMAEVTKSGGNPPSKLDEYLSAEEQAVRKLEQEEKIYKITKLTEADAGRVALIRRILTSKIPVALPSKAKSTTPRRK
jgi:hypothetical protein